MLQKNGGVNSKKWIVVPKHLKTQPNSITLQGFEGGLGWLSTYLPGSLWILGPLRHPSFFRNTGPCLGHQLGSCPWTLKNLTAFFIAVSVLMLEAKYTNIFHLGSFPHSASAKWLKNSVLPLSERSLWITPFISSEPLSEGTDLCNLEGVRISHVIGFLFPYWFSPQFPPAPSHFTTKEEEIKLYFQLCIWKSPWLNIQDDLPEVRLSTSSPQFFRVVCHLFTHC